MFKKTTCRLCSIEPRLISVVIKKPIRPSGRNRQLSDIYLDENWKERTRDSFC